MIQYFVGLELVKFVDDLIDRYLTGWKHKIERELYG
jgi:hypothetical protein